MYRIVTLLAVTGLACALAVPGAGAFDKKKADKSEDLTKGTKESEAAAAVHFDTAFGLSFPSLSTLGTRIAQARVASDPVGLALAAKELEVAEKVSGKHASLTAKDLMSEAVELGKLRKDEQELKALRELVSSDDKTKEEFKTAILDAAKEAKVRSAALGKGEEPRGIRARLIVHNYRNNPLYLSYNGYSVGSVPRRSSRSFSINDTSGASFTVVATDSFGRRWSRSYSGDMTNFALTIR